MARHGRQAGLQRVDARAPLTDWYARAVEMNRTIGTRLHIPIGYYDLMNHDEARRAGWDLADVVMGEG